MPGACAAPSWCSPASASGTWGSLGLKPDSVFSMLLLLLADGGSSGGSCAVFNDAVAVEVPAMCACVSVPDALELALGLLLLQIGCVECIGATCEPLSASCCTWLVSCRWTATAEQQPDEGRQKADQRTALTCLIRTCGDLGALIHCPIGRTPTLVLSFGNNSSRWSR